MLMLDYVSKGDHPLSPFQLKDLRESLLARNGLWDFMIWVMVIIGARMGLRESEIAALGIY
jgi:hypothetical protein